MLKNFKKTNFNKFELFIIIFFIGFILFQNINYLNFSNNFENLYYSEEVCPGFIPPNVDQIQDLQIIKEKRDIYVFPELTNIFCLGKVLNYEVQTENILVYFGTNEKFINFLIFVSKSIILFFYFNFFNKSNYKIIDGAHTLFLIFNFSLSLNIFSYFSFLLFPTIFYFMNNTEDDKEIDKSLRLNLGTFFCLSLLLIIFMIIQFSTHHYETIDWDINAYIVTSMDVGRGFLPLEGQFENKPPFLFIIYYFLRILSNGQLLQIKIFNDLALFLSIINLFLILKKKSNTNFSSTIYTMVFVLLTSNVGFHPGFSEIYSLFFISSAYLIVITRNKKLVSFFISGFLIGLSTVTNIGSSVFIIAFSLLIYLISKNRLKAFLYFYTGIGIVHLILLVIYYLNNLITEYLISVLFIPISYTNSNFSFINEITVYFESVFTYSSLVFIVLAISLVNSISKLFLVKKMKTLEINYWLIEGIFIIFSLFFYFLAGKGYYHHLIFFLFFVSFGISNIPTKKYKFFILSFLIFVSIHTTNKFISQSFENISGFQYIQNNYPQYNVSKVMDSDLKPTDKIFATDNILILFYLDKPNESYIVHPALYSFKEVYDVLVKYEKVNKNEIVYQLSTKPKYFIGPIDKVDFNVYEEINLSSINTDNLSFFDKNKKIRVFKIKN